jgi:hypothetical protein
MERVMAVAVDVYREQPRDPTPIGPRRLVGWRDGDVAALGHTGLRSLGFPRAAMIGCLSGSFSTSPHRVSK